MKSDHPIISFVNIIGQILAFVTILLWALRLLNTAIYAYTDTYFLGNFTGTLELIKYWATLITLALSGLELALKKWWLFIIYAILVAVCVIILLFPDVQATILGAIFKE